MDPEIAEIIKNEKTRQVRWEERSQEMEWIGLCPDIVPAVIVANKFYVCYLSGPDQYACFVIIRFQDWSSLPQRILRHEL